MDSQLTTHRASACRCVGTVHHAILIRPPRLLENGECEDDKVLDLQRSCGHEEHCRERGGRLGGSVIASLLKLGDRR